MSSDAASDTWKQCSSCKSPIAFAQKYWECSVSTCNRSRLPLFFCTVACWDAHLPTARHRSSAYAVEKRSPSRAEAERERAAVEAEEVASSERRERRAPEPEGEVDTSEVLVVAAKVQAYIAERSELRTSRGALFALSHLVRRECEVGIASAREAERKTVMDRDLPRPPAGTKAGEMLIVASRLKAYIKASSGMNTAGNVADVLSAHVRGWIHQAVRAARADERETVMDRDFEAL